MTDCYTNSDDLRYYLEHEEALSCAEILKLLRISLQNALWKQSQGEDVTYLQIRTRTVQYQNPAQAISSIQQMIRYYENCVAAQNPNVSRRNVASFRRG